MIKHRRRPKVNPLLNLLGSKKLRIIIAFALLLFLVFFYKKAFIYVLFLGVTALIIYYTKLYHVPIDISPLFFLEIVITRYYGLQYTLIFILFGYIIPKTFAGTNMKFDSYVFIAISMFANIFVLVFSGMPLIMVGFITSIIQYIVGVLFSMTMKPAALAMLDGVANVANNLVWFLVFSDIITLLMR
ncbi:MAG: hypothetical protein ABIJ34_01790 [archaeon]